MPEAAVAPETKPAVKTVEKPKPKKNFKYGVEWGDAPNINPLSIELACYRDYKTMKTGQTREFHLRKAFCYVWPEFEWNEWCEMMLYAWCNFRLICVIGHTRAGKTFFMAHLALLDYLCSPHNTATTMTTTKFDALKTRMWGDMMRAIESIKNPALQGVINNLFKITNTSNEMKLASSSASHADDKFMIQGVATDSGDKTAGKIRGQHSERRRILVDEAQDVANAIYVAFQNAFSAPDFVGVLLSNPVEKLSEFGNWCEPENGWSSVTADDLFWRTKMPNGICLHFDGLKSPNIKGGKEVNKNLLRQDYIDNILKTSGAESLQWWMFVRGFFPPDGIVAKIWPSNAVEKARQNPDFDFIPEPCATLDAAFDSDDCVLHLGKLGRLRDGKPCCKGASSTVIQTRTGPNELPKDYQIARKVMEICKAAGVPPENFIMDETGNARGVLAILRVEWSQKVQGIYYGGEATDRPMRLNDSMKAKEQVRYFVTELWFRASYLAQDGMLCGLTNLNPKTEEDLHARRYELKQVSDRKLMIAEPKSELKGRLGRSPDHGDAFVQFGELMVRKGLIGAFASGAPKRIWEQSRKLAIKASQRYEEPVVQKSFGWGG